MKEKLKNFIKNNKWILFTGILSSVVIILIYTLQKIAPFGNNSMLDVDFYHQYGPLLNELYDRVKSGESLLYSFNTAGGLPFYRNFLNYLSSPFNLILFLFKKENIIMAFSIIIGLKAIFASVTMSYYLKKTFKKDSILISIFGTLYAFSGYFCAYYWNIMWLDGMVFLPLIMLGINKIIEEEKPLLYIVSLALMLFANYFIAYMICIFSVLYFIGVLFYKGNYKIKNILKKCLIFGISSILAACLVSFALIPLFHSLSSISATGDVFPNPVSSFKITDYMFNHFTAANRTVFASDILPLPNIYPGMLTLALIIILFINKEVNSKFKFIAITALSFFFFTFNINTLDFVWHAFHVPNDLPWRYSFIYVFILITIGYYSILKIKKVNIFKLSISFASLILLVLLSFKLEFKNLNDEKTIICIVLLILYYVICIILKSKKIDKRILYSFISLVVIFECTYAVDINWNIDHDIDMFMKNKKPIKELISYAKKDDNDLYRIEKTDYLTLNDGAWYDYYGISSFTSMAYEDVAKAQRMLGMAGNNINSYYYKNYQTPIYNTIFNIKYLIGNYTNNDYYVPIKSEEEYNLIGYKKYSSIAYAVNKDILNWKLLTYKPFVNQSNFVALSSGVNDVFVPVTISNITSGNIDGLKLGDNVAGEFYYDLNEGMTELNITLDNKIRDNVYLYVGGSNVSSFEVNNDYYSLTSDEYYVIDTGLIDEDEINVKINFKTDDDGSIYLYAYRLNKVAFEKFHNKISEESLKVTKYNDEIIEGNINVTEDKLLFSSIAYDDGWKIYIDGKEVLTKKVANAYLGCDITKGNHKVKFIYYPKGMRLGYVISTLSLISLIIYVFFSSKRKTKKSTKDEFNV